MGTAALPSEQAIATTIDDASYIDFLVGLRSYAFSDLRAVANRAADDALHAVGKPVHDVPTLRQVLDPVPVIGLRNRIVRSQQEMTWKRVRDTVYERAQEHEAELAAAEKRGPGTLHYSADFQYPDYVYSADIHLQPGSYQGDPLAGYIFQYGTNVFYYGRNDKDEIKEGSANSAPAPADGVVNNVLDLACGIGQTTTALKVRFPQARVVGIDAAAPMVRYAHMRAADRNLEIEFRQELAEDLSFPDESFDMVYVHLIFHEVPLEIGEKVIAEAHRVLRPGGTFTVVDFANRKMEDEKTMYDYHRDVDSVFNGEPYASAFVYCDFEAMLRKHFADVDPAFIVDPGGIRQTRVCRK